MYVENGQQSSEYIYQCRLPKGNRLSTNHMYMAFIYIQYMK